MADLAEALDKYIPQTLRVTRTPGVTVAVADESGQMYSSAFGFADLPEATLMTPGHVMPGGSLSKLALSTAVLQLAERRELDLHQPIGEYTPLAATNPFGCTPVTAYHLGTHTSGLATDTYDATLKAPRPLADHIADGFHSARAREYGGTGSRWAGPAGTYRYSNFGSATLGYIVELANAEELTFTDYVAHHIFDPLGMSSTAIPTSHAPDRTPEHMNNRRAAGYARFGTWCVPTPALHSAIYPSTGVLTTARDYARLLAALFLPGHPQYGTLLSPRMVRTMVTHQVTGEQRGVSHDVGFLLNLGNLGTPEVWFGGAGQYPWGWCAQAQAFPHHRVVVVSLANAWDMPRFVNPWYCTAPGLIGQFVVRWLRGERPATHTRTTTWGQDAAYTAGLVMAERTAALLNVEDGSLATDALAATGAAARSLAAHAEDELWDATAFASGVADMLRAANSPAAITAHLDASLVSRAQLDLHALAWGAPAGDLSLPMDYFAHRRQYDASSTHLDLYS